MPTRTHHEQVQVLSPLGIVEVDAGIAELLEAVWSFGGRTAHSCEGGPPNVPELIESYARRGEIYDNVGYITLPARSHIQELLARLIGAGVVVTVRDPLAEVAGPCVMYAQPAGYALYFPPQDLPRLTDAAAACLSSATIETAEKLIEACEQTSTQQQLSVRIPT